MTAISGTLPATQGSDRERLSAAAKQFEAIFIRQMLSAARKSDLGDTLFGGKGVDTFREMQDARFADLAAESGAFGLAKHIEAQLSPQVSAT
jgi:peptidoglycan hydrolase FlgJ